MGGAVIELDLAEPWEPEPQPTTRWPPRVPGWFLPVVVAIATLLVVSAAAAPRQWDPVLTLPDQNSGLWFGPDDTAYVSFQRSRSARLQAYPPGRKTALWTVNVPGGFAQPVYLADPAMLTVMVFDADPDARGDGNKIQQRDARTGALLWSRDGVGLLGVDSDVVVMSNRQEVGGPVPGPADDVSFTELRTGAVGGPETGPPVMVPPTGMIEAVDRRTGRTVWSRAVPADVLVGSETDAVGRTSTVVELALDGRLRISDPKTGGVRSEARITLLGRPFTAWLSDGRLVVYQRPAAGGNQLSVTYDAASGAEVTRQEARSDGMCADRYRCQSDTGELVITDAVSGAVVFRGRSDQQFLVGDQLTVSWEMRWPEPAGTEMYDLRTGRRLFAYPGWRIATMDGENDILVKDLAGGGLLVGIRDDATGKLTVAGRATGWTGSTSCRRGVRYVGCVGVAGVRVWRLH